MPKGKGKKNTKDPLAVLKTGKLKLVLIGIPVVLVLLFLISIPLSDKILEMNRERILDSVEENYPSVYIGDISGNILAGLILEDLYLMPDTDEVALPVWVGEKATLHYGLRSLITGNYIPYSVVLENFLFRFEQDEDGKLILPNFLPQPYNAQGGQLMLRDLKIVLKNSKVIYNENKVKFPDPLHLEVDRINAKATLHSNTDLKIHNLDCKFLDSDLRFRGRMNLTEKYESDLTLETSTIALWKISDALGRLFPSTNSLVPSGDTSLNVHITGPILTPKLDGKCLLDNMKIGNFRFSDAHLNIIFQDKRLKFTDGIALAYGGRIVLNGEVDASTLEPSFSISAEVVDLNLRDYLSQAVENLDPVSGEFSGNIQGYGNFTDPAMFNATGNLSCDKGMYLNPFREAKTGFLEMRQSERMGFDSLNIDFKIENEQLKFSDFSMDSKWVEIKASGDVHFKGELDIEGTIITEGELLKSSGAFSKVAALIPVANLKVPVKFHMLGTPNNYMIYTALSEDAINKLLGNDAARREAAMRLLEEYFGSTIGNSSDVEGMIPGVE